MTELTALWLPILLSAIIVFVASSVIHMFLKWHNNDVPKLPDEDKFTDAVRPLNIPPGDYIVPRGTMEEMKSPAFDEKLKRGPIMLMTVMPNGSFAMGKKMLNWFIYILVVGVFSAYVAGRALPPGAHYLRVFRFAGVAAFLSYSVALWQMSIWWNRKWSTTILATLDGLIYACLTAGTFGWLWPK
ncbi:MAG TPA: hypothetical protein VKH81_21900 [Candidatus Angelobacter sp.]|nr:hypothetical protein [Candidatus Angelobacter sp.]